MQAIHTDNAPKAIGPYSQAVRAGDLLFVSGQIPIDPATGSLAQGIEEQTHQVLKNLSAILQEAGLTVRNVVKTTVYLTDMGNFATVNGIYAQYFTEQPLPARAAVQVSRLPRDVQVEIELIASYS